MTIIPWQRPSTANLHDGAVEVKLLAPTQDQPGGVLFRTHLGVVIGMDWKVWNEFIAAAKRGEYDPPDEASAPDMGTVSPATSADLKRLVTERFDEERAYAVPVEGEG